MGATSSGLSYQLINWTLVPSFTISGDGLGQMSSERGLPATGALIFPQQFAELHAALAQVTALPLRYDAAQFDATQ